MDVIKRHWEPLTHLHTEKEQDEEWEEEWTYREQQCFFLYVHTFTVWQIHF